MQNFFRFQGVPSYATIATTQKTGKRTSQDPNIIKSLLLITTQGIHALTF